MPNATHNTTWARGQYGDRMLRLLREFGPLTRSELGELSGLSRTTLYEVVSRLVDSGQVIAAVPDSTRRGRGRPAEKLIPNPEAGRVLGIDFGRRAVRVVAVAGDRDDLERQDAISTASEAHSPTAQWPDRLVIARRLVGTLTGGRLRLDALNAVGVAVTGPATDARAPLDRRAMAVMMGRSLGTRVRIDNAARLAALAETVWGAAHGQRDVLYLELSDPVGGALVSGGVLHRGAHGRSGSSGTSPRSPGARSAPAVGGVVCRPSPRPRPCWTRTDPGRTYLTCWPRWVPEIRPPMRCYAGQAPTSEGSWRVWSTRSNPASSSWAANSSPPARPCWSRYGVNCWRTSYGAARARRRSSGPRSWATMPPPSEPRHSCGSPAGILRIPPEKDLIRGSGCRADCARIKGR